MSIFRTRQRPHEPHFIGRRLHLNKRRKIYASVVLPSRVQPDRCIDSIDEREFDTVTVAFRYYFVISQSRLNDYRVFNYKDLIIIILYLNM